MASYAALLARTEYGLLHQVILKPLLQENYQQGLEKGLEQGLEQGRVGAYRQFLQQMLIDRFGALLNWAVACLHTGTEEELQAWGKRMLRTESLHDTLR